MVDRSSWPAVRPLLMLTSFRPHRYCQRARCRRFVRERDVVRPKRPQTATRPRYTPHPLGSSLSVHNNGWRMVFLFTVYYYFLLESDKRSEGEFASWYKFVWPDRPGMAEPRTANRGSPGTQASPERSRLAHRRHLRFVTPRRSTTMVVGVAGIIPHQKRSTWMDFGSASGSLSTLT